LCEGTFLVRDGHKQDNGQNETCKEMLQGAARCLGNG
jgi:hypothetical protein